MFLHAQYSTLLVSSVETMRIHIYLNALKAVLKIVEWQHGDTLEVPVLGRFLLLHTLITPLRRFPNVVESP